MRYLSTRGGNAPVTASQAILRGMAEDGGLFVPESFPHYTHEDLLALAGCSYQERAARILSDLLTDYSREELEECAAQAYAEEKFPGGPAPFTMQQNGPVSMYLLELWHGPTCAFKDLALQILPHLLTKALRKNGRSETALILAATSGDTGKAALEGFRDVPGTAVQVFYPLHGVSAMQRRQMEAQQGGNVFVCGVGGDFDAAQAGVKRIFANPDLAARLSQKGIFLTSANSINWGRLAPQIVYYFSAYCDLMRTGEIDYAGEQVNIAVPTGNFGNLLAAYYARKMGLPVKKFLCASNENHVLTDFLRTGVYDRNRALCRTISPSMDILVSSNLERLLYDVTGGNAARVASWMVSLAQTGRYQVDPQTLQDIQSLFYGGYCTDEEARAEIREMFQTEGYVADPHTAAALHVYRRYVEETQDHATPAILASTASPYKFAADVLFALTGETAAGGIFDAADALSALTGTPQPAPIAALRGLPVRFTASCAADGMEPEVLRAAELL